MLKYHLIHTYCLCKQPKEFNNANIYHLNKLILFRSVENQISD